MRVTSIANNLKPRIEWVLPLTSEAPGPSSWLPRHFPLEVGEKARRHNPSCSRNDAMLTDEQTINGLLTAMLQSGGEGVSDLLFVVGKPPLTEDHGRLSEVKTSTTVDVLSNERVE